MNPSHSGKPSGRAKSCVVCRQFKLACDARKTHPNPCSRCVSKNLNCRFDPNFKRISTRRITQEVANELHELRAVYHAETSSGSTPHSQLIVGGQSPAPFGGNQSVSSHDSSVQRGTQGLSSWLRLNEDEIVLEQTFNGVTMDSTRILKLFYHFDRYYYPHARFLSPLKSINNLAQNSPLLFWTILLLASERYEGHNDLYDHLYIAHDILMSEVLHIAIQKLEIVHALLILCLWPIPKLRNAYDPSWNYIGLAIQAATSLNCHYPVETIGPFSHYKGSIDTTPADLDPTNQAMTWLYCYVIGSRQCAYLGLPPPICLPQHAKSLKRAQHIAVDYLKLEEKTQIKMLDILCDAQIHLDAIDDVNAQYSMLDTYRSRLDDVRAFTQENWSWDLELAYQEVKLYILGIGLLRDIPSDDQQALIYRHLNLQECLESASSYISTLTNLSYQPASGSRYPSGILTFYPKHYFTTLMAAACHVFRNLISSQDMNQAQRSLCMTRLTEAHKIFQSFPDHRDAMRGCINIEMFVNSLRTKPTARLPPALCTNNRLGASIVIDATFRASQQRNLDMMDGSTPSVTNWVSMNEDHAHRLPLAPEQKVVSPRQQQQLMQSWQGDNIALGIWDTYANDFGVLSEPWMGTDAEFASVVGMNGPTTDMPTGSTFTESVTD